MKKVQATHELASAEVEKRHSSHIEDTSRSIKKLQSQLDSFFDEIAFQNASGPRSANVRQQGDKTTSSVEGQEAEGGGEGEDEDETPEQKRELAKKQKQAFTNANAARMFEAFRKLGHGGTGSLTFDDFVALCGGENTSDVRMLFGMLDEDHSGTLEIAEMAHALHHNKEAAQMSSQFPALHDLCHLSRGRKKRGHKHTKAKHEIRSVAQFKAFAKLDGDGNGELSEQEFVEVCLGDNAKAADVAEVKKLFSLLDEDHSGTLSCGELGHVLHSNKEAKKLAKNYAALHDLVHLSHGRRHHKPKRRKRDKTGKGAADKDKAKGKKRHSHHDVAARRFTAFQALDANGDGALDYDEFFAVCGGHEQDADKVRKLFDLLDEDHGGTLEVEEIGHALEHDRAAAELAKTFEALHDLVDLSAARKHRHHHHSHSHHHHKKRHAEVVKERRIALTEELFGAGTQDAGEMCLNHPKLRTMAENEGAEGEKARELVKLFEEEQTFKKDRQRRSLSRRNTTRQHDSDGGGGGGGGPRTSGRHKGKMRRQKSKLTPGQSRIEASHRRGSQERLASMMQVAQLRKGQARKPKATKAKATSTSRWKKTKGRVKLLAALSGGGGRSKPGSARPRKPSLSRKNTSALSPRARLRRASNALKFSGQQNRDIQLFKTFKKIGHDGSGTLDENDFVTLCSGNVGAKRLFALLDEDRSGSLNTAELSHALTHNKEAAKLAEQFPALHDICHLAHGRKKRGHHHKHDESQSVAQFKAFAALDADGNGTLDEEEFIGICVAADSADAAARASAKKLFALLDEDHSGTVSCGELGHALESDREAKELAKNFSALHDLVHLSHGRSTHKHKKHRSSKHHKHKSHHHHGGSAEDAKASRFAAFQKLDANGDGSLSFEEFLAVCSNSGGDDADKVKALFDLLDLDLSGELSVEEIGTALERDPEAQELAKSFHSLHDLVDLSSVRKHGGHHHHHHSHRHHKKRHAEVLEEQKVSLVTELFGTGDPSLITTITSTDARLVNMSQQSGAMGDKARELIKVLEEEATVHQRQKLRRQNSQRHSSRRQSRRRSSKRRRPSNARPPPSAPAGGGRPGGGAGDTTRAAPAPPPGGGSSSRGPSSRGRQRRPSMTLRNSQRATHARWGRVKMMSHLSHSSGNKPALMRSARGPNY